MKRVFTVAVVASALGLLASGVHAETTLRMNISISQNSHFGAAVDDIVPRLIPFVILVFACLMVITYVPWVSLALRDLVYPAAAIR